MRRPAKPTEAVSGSAGVSPAPVVETLAAIDAIASHAEALGLPNQVLASWLRPLIVHLSSRLAGVPDEQLPDRVVKLGLLVGIDLTLANVEQ